MISPAWLPLAGNRFTPFAYAIDVVGVDLTGATLAAQVRATPDAVGDPTASFAISQPSVVTTAGLPTSSIILSLAESAMTAMPAGAEPSDSVVLAWDLVVTLAGGTKFVLLQGGFTVNPGVTHG